MQQRQIILAVGILVLLVVGMFAFAYLKRAEIQRSAPTETGTTTETNSTPTTTRRVDAKHFYSDTEGVHTLVGEVQMPSSCDLLNYPVVVEEDGARARVNFSVTNNSASTTCSAEISGQRFKVIFKANKDAAIDATWNGAPATLNLIPAAPGEDPGDFEMILKG